MRTQEMLQTHPRKPVAQDMFNDLAACITACVECADVCTSCADACLGEQNVQMLTRCIRLNLDCADICQTTARLLTRQTEPEPQLLRIQLEACAISCRMCAEECEKHAEMHKHCRICATACRSCEQMCRQMIKSLPAGAGLSH
ncbi:four-helix bundle copper-binding protein [Geobacter sp. DSM 9736]|uniref:four-helix bundle copper-binding protein n=1 Tax=Geobacter sp. DSM 9736 TaxID=1277350 RepID=UPI000B513F1E|nr:four-helix bundle copper-binding protein [Geobacter sp. DSM 9736]SNB46901.1 hypothetical protein SAMN06269301_2373 [Geobacter sp. DSM 9736]